jgi:hypothetical protein
MEMVRVIQNLLTYSISGLARRGDIRYFYLPKMVFETS